MADGTKIEWTDATWNPVTGCSVVSPGCTNCYAMKLAGGRLRNHPSRVGLTEPSKAGPVWTGEVRLNEEWLDQPLHWREPRRVFVCAHGDLFHEAVPDEWIDGVFAVMALCPQHTFQVLTKRPERAKDYLSVGATCIRVGIRHEAERLFGVDPGAVTKPLPNVWLGVSVEDQARANGRIPLLLETPVAVRFVSAEPLLGPVAIFDMDGPVDVPDGVPSPIHWVIVGGESGPGARPMHPEWARGLRDQCQAVGVPFFFKQWGTWVPNDAAFRADVVPSAVRHPWGRCQPAMAHVGKRLGGRHLDRRTWDEYPQ